jgi:hypothetical protein
VTFGREQAAEPDRGFQRPSRRRRGALVFAGNVPRGWVDRTLGRRGRPIMVARAVILAIDGRRARDHAASAVV